jgi:hypothetical protein
MYNARIARVREILDNDDWHEEDVSIEHLDFLIENYNMLLEENQALADAIQAELDA